MIWNYNVLPSHQVLSCSVLFQKPRYSFPLYCSPAHHGQIQNRRWAWRKACNEWFFFSGAGGICANEFFIRKINRKNKMLLPGIPDCRMSLHFELKSSFTIIFFYSYLKASIGFNFAAFRAGKNPNAIPINAEKPKPIKME